MLVTPVSMMRVTALFIHQQVDNLAGIFICDLRLTRQLEVDVVQVVRGLDLHLPRPIHDIRNYRAYVDHWDSGRIQCSVEGDALRISGAIGLDRRVARSKIYQG